MESWFGYPRRFDSIAQGNRLVPQKRWRKPLAWARQGKGTPFKQSIREVLTYPPQDHRVPATNSSSYDPYSAGRSAALNANAFLQSVVVEREHTVFQIELSLVCGWVDTRRTAIGLHARFPASESLSSANPNLKTRLMLYQKSRNRTLINPPQSQSTSCGRANFARSTGAAVSSLLPLVFRRAELG